MDGCNRFSEKKITLDDRMDGSSCSYQSGQKKIHDGSLLLSLNENTILKNGQLEVVF